MKRVLFFVLLLANIGIFAWYRGYVLPAETSPSLAPPLNGQPLKLTSELNPDERKALTTANASVTPAPATSPAPAASTQTPPPASTAVLASATGCATYGPFGGMDEVQQAESRLKQLGLTATDHSVAGKTRPGYWVYLPPFGSRKEADAAVALMKKRGVSDIYVVADEANRNAISLGIFSQKEYALDRIKELKKLGYHPQVSARFREEPRYWVDARGVAGSLPPADLFKDLGQDDNPIGRGTGVCSGTG